MDEITREARRRVEEATIERDLPRGIIGWRGGLTGSMGYSEIWRRVGARLRAQEAAEIASLGERYCPQCAEEGHQGPYLGCPHREEDEVEVFANSMIRIVRGEGLLK